MPSVSWISPPAPARIGADHVEHAGREDVAAGHAHARRRLVGIGLLDHPAHLHEALADLLAGHDAVALDLLGRHFLHRQDAGLGASVLFDHLGQHRGAAVRPAHQVVGQQHGERLVVHQRLRAEDGMAEPERPRLPHEGAEHVVRRERAHQGQQLLLAVGFEFALEFVGGVEMVFDGTLVAARDEDHVADAGAVRLLDRVLDQRLVDDRQHLLGLRLGGRQESGAETRHREDGLVDPCDVFHRLESALWLKFGQFFTGCCLITVVAADLPVGQRRIHCCGHLTGRQARA